MAMSDVLARISEVEAKFVQLSALGAATTATTTQTSVKNAEAFEGALRVAATGTATTGVTGEAIVEAAKKYIGVPYVLGGEDASGMDCSGLVQRVLADLGIDAPRVVSTQQNIGEEVASLADARPGDLIVTHNADHIVIYAGNGMIIHAPYEGRTVSLQANYLTDADIKTIRRVAPAGTGTDTSALAGARTALAGLGSNTDLSSLISSLGGTATASPSVTDLIGAAQLSMFTGGRS